MANGRWRAAVVIERLPNRCGGIAESPYLPTPQNDPRKPRGISHQRHILPAHGPLRERGCGPRSGPYCPFSLRLPSSLSRRCTPSARTQIPRGRRCSRSLPPSLPKLVVRSHAAIVARSTESRRFSGWTAQHICRRERNSSSTAAKDRLHVCPT